MQGQGRTDAEVLESAVIAGACFLGMALLLAGAAVVEAVRS